MQQATEGKNVRQWQQMFYNKRYSNTIYSSNPDFVAVAEAMGVKGFSASAPEDIRSALEKAMAVDGPALINFCIPQEALVMPMVTPGDAIDKMVFN